MSFINLEFYNNFGNTASSIKSYMIENYVEIINCKFIDEVPEILTLF